MTKVTVITNNTGVMPLPDPAIPMPGPLPSALCTPKDSILPTTVKRMPFCLHFTEEEIEVRRG